MIFDPARVNGADFAAGELRLIDCSGLFWRAIERLNASELVSNASERVALGGLLLVGWIFSPCPHCR